MKVDGEGLCFTGKLAIYITGIWTTSLEHKQFIRQDGEFQFNPMDEVTKSNGSPVTPRIGINNNICFCVVIGKHPPFDIMIDIRGVFDDNEEEGVAVLVDHGHKVS